MERDFVVQRGFLTEQECAYWIGVISDLPPQSTLLLNDLHPSYGMDNRRKSCLFGEAAEMLKARVAEALDLPPWQEQLRGIHHWPGPASPLHLDTFDPELRPHDKHYLAAGGQRTYTAMIYLNRPVGGGLHVPSLKRVEPLEAGKLVAFRNADGTGNPIPHSLHTGTEVRSGDKFALMTLFRERDPGIQQWGRLPKEFFS